jgi:hypothetical protein
MYEASPAWPHGHITQVFEGVYFVMGTNKVEHEGLHLQTSRTMLVVREGRDLTLINTVRLDDHGLGELEALGQVRHVIRLGAFHGRDDPFYRDHFGAALWALAGSSYADGRPAHRTLSEASELPIPGARAFVFHSAKHPEAALVLQREGGILVTCDAVQNWDCVDEFFSTETAAMFVEQGLIGTANVPSTWRGACEPTRADFERLLALNFRHLVSAHGRPLLDDAHTRLRATVDELEAAFIR